MGNFTPLRQTIYLFFQMICNFLLCPNAIVSRIFCACYCWSLIQHCIFLSAQICNCVAQIPEFSCALFEQLMLCFLSGNYAHHFYRKFSLHQTQWAVWLLHFSKGCEHEQKEKMHVAFFFFLLLFLSWIHIMDIIYKTLARMSGYCQAESERGLPRMFW